ncbi:hypothetical protein Btru_012341 [Bulinus truncatus]|nr:hypothetical protein Btru_012341 [Bulinus truncatus]
MTYLSAKFKFPRHSFHVFKAICCAILKQSKSISPGDDELLLEGYKSDFKGYCSKKDGHKNFIEFQKLELSHFPESFRDHNLVELTKALGNLVVRLDVNKHSPERPEFLPGITKKFPKKGDLGTGRITFSKPFRGTRFRHCPCSDCEESDVPFTDWGEVTVQTSAHVVFDQLEAENTTCIFRYNHENSTRVEYFQGHRVYKVDLEHDVCRFTFITHDMEMVQLFIRSIYLFQDKHKHVFDKFKAFPNKNLAIMVSHPHGWPKQVSIGKYERKESVSTASEDRVNTSYSYSLTTCLGSSGAPVYFLGKEDVWSLHTHKWSRKTADGHIGHSGTQWERVSRE